MKPTPGRSSDFLAHAPSTAADSESRRPPILGPWTALYAILIAELLAVILLCYWITQHNE